MSLKHNMSHNACYDYSRCRWNLQPGDMVKFYVRDEGSSWIGEVLFLSLDLLHVRRLKDDRIFVVSTFDMRDWKLSRVDYVQRLPNGIFSVGERVELDGDLNLPEQEFYIIKFEFDRVKLQCFVKGRFVCCFWALLGEVLKVEGSKTYE